MKTIFSCVYPTLHTSVRHYRATTCWSMLLEPQLMMRSSSTFSNIFSVRRISLVKEIESLSALRATTLTFDGTF